MFKEERGAALFEWSMIGDIGEGRPNLGPTMDVAVYRLMQFTMRDVLIARYGVEAADIVLYTAGELAGKEFCKALIEPGLDLRAFLQQVQTQLETLKIGILRVERFDLDTMEGAVTVAEDLDCSGLMVCEETICTYDEGFLSGLMSQYTGIPFTATEVDCWCSGDRVCRFEIHPAS